MAELVCDISEKMGKKTLNCHHFTDILKIEQLFDLGETMLVPYRHESRTKDWLSLSLNE